MDKIKFGKGLVIAGIVACLDAITAIGGATAITTVMLALFISGVALVTIGKGEKHEG